MSLLDVTLDGARFGRDLKLFNGLNLLKETRADLIIAGADAILAEVRETRDALGLDISDDHLRAEAAVELKRFLERRCVGNLRLVIDLTTTELRKKYEGLPLDILLVLVDKGEK